MPSMQVNLYLSKIQQMIFHVPCIYINIYNYIYTCWWVEPNCKTQGFGVLRGERLPMGNFPAGASIGDMQSSGSYSGLNMILCRSTDKLGNALHWAAWVVKTPFYVEMFIYMVCHCMSLFWLILVIYTYVTNVLSSQKGESWQTKTSSVVNQTDSENGLRIPLLQSQ